MKKMPPLGSTLALLAMISCTIKTPEVSFTSERTAMEKQILGSYRTIEEDAWMIASVRSTGGGKVSSYDKPTINLPTGKREALEAFAERKFNADDIEDFKKAETVGETAQGLLIIRSDQKYNENADYRALVDTVVAEENRDRQIIMARLVEVNSTINPLDQTSVARVFAQMNQEASPPGTWIQKEDGNWVKK